MLSNQDTIISSNFSELEKYSKEISNLIFENLSLQMEVAYLQARLDRSLILEKSLVSKLTNK